MITKQDAEAVLSIISNNHKINITKNMTFPLNKIKNMSLQIKEQVPQFRIKVIYCGIFIEMWLSYYLHNQQYFTCEKIEDKNIIKFANNDVWEGLPLEYKNINW